MKLIKGFVDILILASGYCSSGMGASWDAENIKKAIRWGIFFENVTMLIIFRLCSFDLFFLRSLSGRG